MSSVTSSAPLSLIWRGTWQASGVNSNGYQRYDCVSHTVTSPTTRTDLYFAVTEIASGGAEPNPTSGQTTWKLLLEGGTIAASDGSIVYHDAEGNNVLIQAAADRILEVVNGIPQFLQRDPAPVATFEGYKLPTTTNSDLQATVNAFWISGDRVFGLGTMWEGYISTSTEYANDGVRYTPTPVLFAPRDDDAQVPIGKIFTGHRCIMAIGKDDKSKVYGLGLNAGRFGDSINDNTTFVYDAFQKVQFFEDNNINIESIVMREDTVPTSFTTADTANTDSNARNHCALAYFLQEVVDVGGVDTGGNVYLSASSTHSFASLAGGIARDGTVRQLTGFDQPIIGITQVNTTTYFWSKRKVYGLGSITTTAGGAAVDTATVTELGSFDSDIVDFYAFRDTGAVGALVLADGRAYYYNYKAPINTRTSPLFEQMTVISGKLYRKVITVSNGNRVIAVMDDNSLYYEGAYIDGSTTRTVTGLTEVELPYDIEIRDIYFDEFGTLVAITTDGNVIANRLVTNRSMINVTSYRMDISFAGNNITFHADPGWAGRAERLTFPYPGNAYVHNIQTEDGYIYTSNTIGLEVDQADQSYTDILTQGERPIGVNFQHQVFFSSTTVATITASSYGFGDATTGLRSINTTSPTYSVIINGSMIQRPTLRSYQVT